MTLEQEVGRIVFYASVAEGVTESYTCKKCKTVTLKTSNGDGTWTVGSHDKPNGGHCKKGSNKTITD